MINSSEEQEYNINSDKILDKFKKDLEESRTIHQVVNDYVSKMRNIYEGNVNNVKDKGSTFVSREVFKQVEWAKAQYKHPFVSNDTIVRLSATLGQGNREFSAQSEKLLNYFFTKKFNRFNFMNDAIHTLLVEGTLIVRTGWEYEGEEKELEIPLELDIPQQVENPDTKEVSTIMTKVPHIEKVIKEVPIINKPTASVVKISDVFIDPTANTQEELQFVIHRREVRLHELRKAGIYHNLDEVKKLAQDTQLKNSYTQPYQQELNPQLNFNLEDAERTKLYMYEYWGYNTIGSDDEEVKPIVCSWIGDTIIRLEDNPYPDKKIPYIIMQFIKEPHTLFGKSLADMLEEHQRIKTGLMRGIFDDLAQSNNTQKGVQKGNLDPVNFKRFQNGDAFEFNMSPNAFYQGQYNRIPSEIFKVLQDVDYDKQLLSGVVPMQGGQGSQAIYGSQAGKSGQISSLMLKELDVVTNISDNLIKPLLLKWLIYIYDLLEPNEIINITGSEIVPLPRYTTTTMNDDFTIDISTQQTDEIKASELAFLMQTLGQTLPFDMTKLVISEITKLKKMPNLAQEIMQYQQQPDPIQRQLQQIELQKAQLELQIMQQQAQSEVNYKNAKAKEADAKATSISTGVVKEKYGIDTQQKMQELQLKHQMDMEKLQEQARLKSNDTLPNNIGITKNTQKPITQSNIQNQTI